MEVYRFYSRYNDDFIIYKEKLPVLKAKRKKGRFFNTNVKIFTIDDEKLILEYDYFEFLVVKVKIVFQDLPVQITVKRKNLFSYSLRVDDVEIFNRFSNNFFSKKFGKTYLNKNEVASISRKVLSLHNEFELKLESFTQYEMYCIIMLLIDLTAIEIQG